MQLHPQAQWSALAFDPRIKVSATLDTMPRRRPIAYSEITPTHVHLIVRDEADYGQIAWEYAFSDELPPWIGPRLFTILGVTSPAVSLSAYHATRWWGEDWPMGPTAARLLEEAGGDLMLKWRHDWLLN